MKDQTTHAQSQDRFCWVSHRCVRHVRLKALVTRSTDLYYVDMYSRDTAICIRLLLGCYIFRFILSIYWNFDLAFVVVTHLIEACYCTVLQALVAYPSVNQCCQCM